MPPRITGISTSAGAGSGSGSVARRSRTRSKRTARAPAGLVEEVAAAGRRRRRRLGLPGAGIAFRRRGSVTTVADPVENTSVPLTASASAVTRSPARNSPATIARASGFSTNRWMVRLSGRAPYAGSVPSRTMSARAAGRQLEHDVLPGEAPVEVGDQQLDDPLEVGIGQRMEDDDLVDAVEELGPEGATQRSP